MKYDAVIIGGGSAGLTSAAYLSKSGYSTLVCEKEQTCGGLVNTFARNGFSFDSGIRAMENSGVVFPMVKQLGLDIEFLENHISIGIEDKVIRVKSEATVDDYQALLVSLYPESKHEITQLITAIRKIMKYMEVQYGIDNPVFLDLTKDREYLLKSVLPWMFQYVITSPKISALNIPVEGFVSQHTRNQSLLDIIVQHFFRETPAFFALSYLKLFLEYHYPRGGTGQFTEKMVRFILDHQGTIKTGTEIVSVDPSKRVVVDALGNLYEYDRLIWAADQKAFYRLLTLEGLDAKARQAVEARRTLLDDKTGNDSVLTLYLAVDLDKQYFSKIASEHFFYTPLRTGLSKAGPAPIGQEWEAVKSWLESFLQLTTYEISIPVLRDSTLAPAGQTGLIISTLFDYHITKYIQDRGWYKAFTNHAETCMINALASSIYPDISNRILDQFSATPLTIAKIAGTTDGAITGWAFTNHPIPAENRIPKIMNAIRTPIAGIYQAGQWTYSPSGFPISLLTGKLAADQVMKELDKKPGRSTPIN